MIAFIKNNNHNNNSGKSENDNTNNNNHNNIFQLLGTKKKSLVETKQANPQTNGYGPTLAPPRTILHRFQSSQKTVI